MSIILGTQLSNVAAQTTLDLQGLITSMQVSGMSNTAIKASLMADLTGGGRIFGNYRNQVKNTVKSGVSMAGSNASKDIFTKAGVEKFRWQTVQGDTVCPDCEPRHGQIESMKVWEMIGTPQSGFSVCQQYCQCQLIAADYKGENLDKPLVRGKQLSINDIKMAGKHNTTIDAESWAKSNIANKVDYSGTDIKTANLINSELKNIKDSGLMIHDVKPMNHKTDIFRWDVSQDLNTGYFTNITFRYNKRLAGSTTKLNDSIKKLRSSGQILDATPKSMMTHEYGHFVADLNPISKFHNASVGLDDFIAKHFDDDLRTILHYRQEQAKISGKYLLHNTEERFAELYRLWKEKKLIKDLEFVGDYLQQLKQ